jgi:hypothetical protein
MSRTHPRATGHYATFQGREYHATVKDSDVILRSYRGEPEVLDFIPSRIAAVQGIRTVPRSELEKLSFVRTVCRWKGEPFMVVGVGDGYVDVFYIGSRGEWIVQQPGIVRTGKLEAHGRLQFAEITDIYEFVDPLAP